MIKQTYLKILPVIGLLALIFTLPSAPLMAQTSEERSSVTTSSSSTAAQPAQEQSSVTSSTRSTSSSTASQPAEESSSVTKSTRSTSSTTVAQPVEERSSVTNSTKSTTVAQQAGGEHRCVGYCRGQYDRSMSECNEPGHPHHHKCEEWARDREKECLEKCYKE